MKIGTVFKARNKLGRTERYILVDTNPFDNSEEFKLQEVMSGTILEVEAEWFRQREIEIIGYNPPSVWVVMWQSAEETSVRVAASEEKAYEIMAEWILGEGYGFDGTPEEIVNEFNEGEYEDYANIFLVDVER